MGRRRNLVEFLPYKGVSFKYIEERVINIASYIIKKNEKGGPV